MYRVMLIDDEPLIVEGLSKVVDWQSFSCEVAGIAFDAKEGEEKIREMRPHILFTDVNMPETSGLEMLRRIRNEFPLMQVSIISGHSDFSLAQDAMKLGACRYLLKPTKMDEIYEAIGAMVVQLQQNPLPEDEKKEIVGEFDHASSFVVRQALQFMREHSHEKLALSQVAEHCYVSQWHLSKLLNRQVQKNFYDILNQIRIEKAKELLKDGSLRISDVSDLVGYAEATHFSRIFKKETGMSANEYRSTL